MTTKKFKLTPEQMDAYIDSLNPTPISDAEYLRRLLLQAEGVQSLIMESVNTLAPGVLGAVEMSNPGLFAAATHVQAQIEKFSARLAREAA